MNKRLYFRTVKWSILHRLNNHYNLNNYKSYNIYMSETLMESNDDLSIRVLRVRTVRTVWNDDS